MCCRGEDLPKPSVTTGKLEGTPVVKYTVTIDPHQLWPNNTMEWKWKVDFELQGPPPLEPSGKEEIGTKVVVTGCVDTFNKRPDNREGDGPYLEKWSRREGDVSGICFTLPGNRPNIAVYRVKSETAPQGAPPKRPSAPSIPYLPEPAPQATQVPGNDPALEAIRKQDDPHKRIQEVKDRERKWKDASTNPGALLDQDQLNAFLSDIDERLKERNANIAKKANAIGQSGTRVLDDVSKGNSAQFQNGVGGALNAGLQQAQANVQAANQASADDNARQNALAAMRHNRDEMRKVANSSGVPDAKRAEAKRIADNLDRELAKPDPWSMKAASSGLQPDYSKLSPNAALARENVLSGLAFNAARFEAKAKDPNLSLQERAEAQRGADNLRQALAKPDPWLAKAASLPPTPTSPEHVARMKYIDDLFERRQKARNYLRIKAEVSPGEPADENVKRKTEELKQIDAEINKLLPQEK